MENATFSWQLASLWNFGLPRPEKIALCGYLPEIFGTIPIRQAASANFAALLANFAVPKFACRWMKRPALPIGRV